MPMRVIDECPGTGWGELRNERFSWKDRWGLTVRLHAPASNSVIETVQLYSMPVHRSRLSEAIDDRNLHRLASGQNDDRPGNRAGVRTGGIATVQRHPETGFIPVTV